MTPENIEILPVSLLESNRSTVTRLKHLARQLGLEFGWHYLLDLTWIIQQLGPVSGKRIMDAGAGTGIMQWYLADEGAQVLSVDRASRADLPLRFRRRFRVRGLRKQDLLPTGQLIKAGLQRPGKLRARLSWQARQVSSLGFRRRAPGEVIIYNQDLKYLADIPDASLDAVVAVSALEHNSPHDLQLVVNELLRVLKPGCPLLATLGAAPGEDWFHTPSQGWCYSDASLRRCFQLAPEIPSNYAAYDELFTSLRDCTELRDSLARFYFSSGNNGMPWGKWDPQYQPVGVLKIKSGAVIATYSP
jgi:ubiquinone/menaquinone biosynthesis C-methylase UbiE